MSEHDYWWCPECKEEVSPGRVTYSEMHEDCGHPVVSKVLQEDLQSRIDKLEKVVEASDKFYEEWFNGMFHHKLREASEAYKQAREALK